jgi:glycerol-3-phosphate dehydrogenase
MIVELVRDAVANGAELLTYARVTRIDTERGAVVGCEWRTRSGELASARAPVVVNAAGPWVDEVLGKIGRRRLIGGTKGSHLVVAPFPGAPSSGVYVEAGSDARPFFILPWNDLYLIGTTDERFDGDASAVTIDEREWQYLVAETERVFPGAAPLGPRVLYTQTGIRPLPHRPRSAEGAITRRHLIQPHRHARGLYSIVGGKLTTHRALAEDVLRALKVHFPDLPSTSPTRDRRLPGALNPSDRDQLIAAIGSELGPAHAQRLWRLYGAAAIDVAALAREREITADAMPRSRALVAELVHAIRDEWAVTLLDILQRRCMIGLGADFGLHAAPVAADWLCRLGLWDRQRADQEVADYLEYARRARARDALTCS